MSTSRTRSSVRGLRRNRARVLRGPGAQCCADNRSRRRSSSPSRGRLGPPQPHVIDQFHHPEDSEHPDPVQRQEGRQPTGLQDAGSYFHTDYSYLQVPARATTLYSIVVPKKGGDTLFANQQAAYDDLSDAMKTADRAALRHPSLRQSARHRRGRAAPRRRRSPTSRRRRCRSSPTESRGRIR
mgnify:CR=1 FL=1